MECGEAVFFPDLQVLLLQPQRNKQLQSLHKILPDGQPGFG
jgi:hypothetical protein